MARDSKTAGLCRYGPLRRNTAVDAAATDEPNQKASLVQRSLSGWRLRPQLIEISVGTNLQTLPDFRCSLRELSRYRQGVSAHYLRHPTDKQSVEESRDVSVAECK